MSPAATGRGSRPGALERFMGANTFLAFFGAAYLLAKVVEAGLGRASPEIAALS